jgi:glycine cleavage system aminomethyltransferase T
MTDIKRQEKTIMDYKFQTMNVQPFTPIPDIGVRWAPAFVGISPWEFTNWRDETISWKKTCYLHAGLNPADTLKLKGPDVIKFLSRVCVTNFNNFPVGMIKHGVVCNEQGLIIQDGVLMRTGEDEVISYWMVPLLNYALDTGKYGKYDVKLEYLTGKVFLFQIGGPVSIDVLETACGKSLRDLKFLRFTDGVIAGKLVRICRIGMAGTLAYEVHGAIEDAHPVYDAIYKTGAPLGMRRLGSHCYPMNHAENGFPQFGVHFVEPRIEDKKLMDYMEHTPGMEFWAMHSKATRPLGSAADDINHFYHTPYEFGWGKMIKFDHDFAGRAALEKIAAENKRQIVTLEWNLEDITDVFASQFRDEEPYKYIENPTDMDFWPDLSMGISHDKMINQKGEMIGVSFGRQNSAYFHRMISICCLDTAYTALGAEVMIVWGEPGTRQKNIRAKVARYPYNNVLRNESTDVSKLPRATP